MSTEPRKASLKDLDFSIVQQCMHCGMCLPTCPTYVETKLERNSPRGRIAWMRSIAEGETTVDKDFADEMYYCLGCLACTTACPAGVDYPTLFETSRAEIEATGVADSKERNFWRALALKGIFMRPRLLRFIGKSLRFYQKSGIEAFFRKYKFFGLIPSSLKSLEPQAPRMSPKTSNQLIRETEKPQGETKHRVAMLTGCVQDIAFSDVNRDTVDVLLANGCEVFTPQVQSCCGSLHAHNGAIDLATELAKRMIDLIDPASVDAIISNAGGCGSHLKHYTPLLINDPKYAEKAVLWDSKIKDIHEWLAIIGYRKPTASPARLTSGSEEPVTLTYHQSCHLCHGQKVIVQPHAILQSIPGTQLVPLVESDWCCGSAGIYNITQPEQSAKLLDRKIGHIHNTTAKVVATANPGCHLQIQNGDNNLTVLHPISILADAYRSEK